MFTYKSSSKSWSTHFIRTLRTVSANPVRDRMLFRTKFYPVFMNEVIQW